MSQMKQTRRLFFHILLYFTDVFSPSVCKFIAKRDYENHNSGILAWVTSFTGEDTLGLIELNEFVFGANPRVDILHRVVVWQRAKRRAVSKLEYWFTCNIVVCHPKITLYTTEAEEGQSKNILQIQKNILNRNVFLKSLSKSLTNLKNYCKS